MKIAQKRSVLEMICFSWWFWLWCAFYNRALKKHVILLSKCTSRLADKNIHIKLVSSVYKVLLSSCEYHNNTWQLIVFIHEYQIIFIGKFTTTVRPTDTVKNLKKKIQSHTNVSPEKQQLLFNGTLLQDGKCLKEYNIQMGSTLRLAACLHGVSMEINLKTQKGEFLFSDV